MPLPKILIFAPPPFSIPKGPIAPKFEGAGAKSAGLARAYRAVAAELACDFLDAGEVTSTSTIDGVHLDADQHVTLGAAITRRVLDILA